MVETGDSTNLAPIRLKGIGVSPGVVVARAYLLQPDQWHVSKRALQPDEIEHEICRFEDALIETRRQIKTIQKNLESRTAIGDASILDAHLMVLDDRTLIEEVVNGIRENLQNAEFVVKNATERYAAVLGSVEDDYLRERVTDIRDVARRIVHSLSGKEDETLGDVDGEYVLIAQDLAPSLTASLQKDHVLGIATDHGSATSHTAVMARAMEIPAIVGLRNVSDQINTGDLIAMDGNRGIFIIRPTEDDLEAYGRLAETRRSISQGLVALHDKPAETRDGHRILLSANSEGPEELDSVLQYGAEGIGLFRTEYMFLSHGSSMTEDAQAKIYTEVAQRLSPSPVIIRTQDIGGDKFLANSQSRKEANPFLGCRSIRLSLLYPEHFKRQLRAILRASAGGNVKIMYPMISGAKEVLQANALLDESKEELRKRGVPFDENMDVGIMVEIPSAALTADIIAKHVDFFSIGTNDLVQYSLAVDRVNERVAYLYEPMHPAVLKLMKNTIDAGHAAGIWVGICGELAADPLATPLLVGMGLDELSVAPAAVPIVKDVIRALEKERAEKLAHAALRCKSAGEVLSLCRELTSEVAPELLDIL